MVTYAEAGIAFFKGYELREPATPAIRKNLEVRLNAYRSLLATWRHIDPENAFILEPGYRDTVYKIMLAEAALASPRSNIAELAKAQFALHGSAFNPKEFWDACNAIAVHLEESIHAVSGA